MEKVKTKKQENKANEEKCLVCDEIRPSYYGKPICKECFAEGYRYCSRCEEIRTVDDFYDGGSTVCKECCNKARRESYATGRKQRIKSDKDYRPYDSVKELAKQRLREEQNSG